MHRTILVATYIKIACNPTTVMNINAFAYLYYIIECVTTETDGVSNYCHSNHDL